MAKVEAGKDREVLREVKSLNGVIRVNATYGIYDIFIEVNFKSIEDLDSFVFDKLRKIPCIKETVTVICSETMT